MFAIRAINGRKWKQTNVIVGNRDRRESETIDEDRTSLARSLAFIEKINVAWRTALAFERLNIFYSGIARVVMRFSTFLSSERSAHAAVCRGRPPDSDDVYVRARVCAQVDCRSPYVNDSLKVSLVLSLVA